MKYLLLSVLSVVIMSAEAKVTISDHLIDSICQVESGGNPNAIGDHGNSVGIAQIQKICVDDVNRILKLKKSSVRYTYSDRKSVTKSKEMMKIYLSFYGNQYFKQTGLMPTDQVLSRIWNGGPTGWKMKATIAYMKRVDKYLVA